MILKVDGFLNIAHGQMLPVGGYSWLQRGGYWVGNMSNANERSRTPSVVVMLLAAGRSSRMRGGSSHKLLATFDGVPLIRRVAKRAMESKAASVVVVTGYQSDHLASHLSDLDLTIVKNERFSGGLATSIVAGLSALDSDRYDGVMIMLGDMPGVTSKHIDALIERFEATAGLVVVRASHEGAPGNPVILPAVLYANVLQLTGDSGAKKLIESSGIEVQEVEIGAAAALDVDTEIEIEAAGGVLAD